MNIISSLLTLNYVDEDISADECLATALINSVNPEVDIAIELIEPEDGVALVGEYIRFDITVSNPGPTPLTYLLLNNTFTASEMTYTGSSISPDIVNPGSMYSDMMDMGAQFSSETDSEDPPQDAEQ